MNIHAHKEQKKYTGSEELKNRKSIKWEDIPDINNAEKYDWHQVGDSKYGRFMYCPKTKIKRTQTMGEFYGTGIVD